LIEKLKSGIKFFKNKQKYYLYIFFKTVYKKKDNMNQEITVRIQPVCKHITINNSRQKKGDKIFEIDRCTANISRRYAK
ncbi:hypothetical protein ACTHS7_13445, partial [Neisseria sp. P0015.S009]